MKHGRIHSALLIGALACGCAQQADDTAQVDEVDPSSAQVQDPEESTAQGFADLEWKFEPSEREAATVRRLVDAFVRSQETSALRRFGVLHRFDQGETQARYLLLTYLETPDNADPDAVLFVLGDKVPPAAEPLRIGRWGIGTWGPIEVSDYDGDALPDVAFCEWPSEEAQLGQLRVAGLRAGGWYMIRDPRGTLPDCSR